VGSRTAQYRPAVSGDSVQVWSEGDYVRPLLPVFALVIGIAAVVADPSSAGDLILAAIPAAAFAAWAYLRNAPLLPVVLGVVIPVVVAQRNGQLEPLQQMGFGVAVALLIDATIVRGVLMPAAMKLLGGWNWYLPAWLSWLPDAHVEGAAPREPTAARASWSG
jgi:uncharacterized membrane protein YdfJ with MMPL/SSD domain